MEAWRGEMAGKKGGNSGWRGRERQPASPTGLPGQSGQHSVCMELRCAGNRSATWTETARQGAKTRRPTPHFTPPRSHTQQTPHVRMSPPRQKSRITTNSAPPAAAHLNTPPPNPPSLHPERIKKAPKKAKNKKEDKKRKERKKKGRKEKAPTRLFVLDDLRGPALVGGKGGQPARHGLYHSQAKGLQGAVCSAGAARRAGHVSAAQRSAVHPARVVTRHLWDGACRGPVHGQLATGKELA